MVYIFLFFIFFAKQTLTTTKTLARHAFDVDVFVGFVRRRLKLFIRCIYCFYCFLDVVVVAVVDDEVFAVANHMTSFHHSIRVRGGVLIRDNVKE